MRRLQIGFLFLVLLASGCQKSPQKIVGRFSFNAEGKAVQFSELSNSPKAQEQSIALSFSTSGQFVADPSQRTVFFQSISVQSQDAKETVLKPITNWAIKFANDGFQADQKLSPEQEWISKCFVSYWQSKTPQIGIRKSQEIDGENTIAVAKRGNDWILSWLELAPEVADLMSMPNREDIPITRKVRGELRYVVTGELPTIIGGTKETQSFLAKRKVGQNSLNIQIEQNFALGEAPKFRPLFSYALKQDSNAAVNEHELQKKYLKGATLQSLLNKANKPLDTKSRNAVFLSLRALFYLYPQECSSAVKQAKSDLQMDLVAEALAGAGNESAQDALVQILTQSKGEQFRNRVTLIVDIVPMSENLQAAVVNFASGNALPPSEKYVAQLALGSNIRRCGPEFKAQSDRFVKALSDAMQHAKTQDEQQNLLYAFGNAASEQLLPTQLAYLENPSPVLRYSAVHSLRFLIDSGTVQRLKKVLATEPNSQVKKEIDDVLAKATAQN